MKINSKGFMLAEIIIVSAVLITTIVSLYAGFANIYSAYNERSKYFDVNAMYSLKNLDNLLIDNMLINEFASKNEIMTIDFGVVTNGNEQNVTVSIIDSNNSDICTNSKCDFLNAFAKESNFDKVYFLNTNAFNEFKEINKDDTDFYNYLEFYNNQLDEDDKINTYGYMLVGITNDDTYAILRIK